MTCDYGANTDSRAHMHAVGLYLNNVHSKMSTLKLNN